MSNTKILYEKGYRISPEHDIINPKGEVLKGGVKNGYRVVYCRKDKKPSVVFVHRLAAYQKFGDSMFAPGVVVRHLNGNSLDNSYGNIALGTQSQNMMDKPPEVRMRCALNATSHVRKYDRSEVKSYYQEHGFKKAMEHFGISSKGTMSFILNG